MTKEHTYRVRIHPAFGLDAPLDPPIEVDSFKAGDAGKALKRINALITTFDPPLDLDGRVEIDTDNPNWRNKDRLTVDEYIAPKLHGGYPRSSIGQ